MARSLGSHLEMERGLEVRERVVAALSLAWVVALPFLHNLRVSYVLSYPKVFALQAATLAAWAGLLVVRPARLEERLGASGFGWPMLAAYGWAGLTVWWSGYRWAAVEPLVRLGYMGAAVVALANLFAATRVRRWFVAVYGAAAGAACLVYVLCSLRAESFAAVYPFGNPNVAGAFALVPFAVGTAYAISALAGRVRSWTGGAGAAVAVSAVAAVMASGSTGAAVGAAGAFVLVAVYSFRGRVRRSALEGLCVLAVLAVLWPVLAPGLWPREWVLRELGARPAMWGGALRLVRERPVVGHGVGTFFVEYARVHPVSYAAHRYASMTVENAHCLLLHLWVEVGLVGVALAGWLAWRVWRTARRAAREADHVDRALLRGLMAGAAGMLAQGLASTALHQVECTVNLVLALALIGGVSGVRWRPRVPTGRGGLGWRIGSVLVLLGLFFATAGTGLARQWYLRRGRSGRGLAAQERMAVLRRAVDLGWPTIWTLRGRVWLADLLQRAGRTREALEEIETVGMLAPNFELTRRQEAALRLRLGQVARAAGALVAYCEKDPFDPEAYRIWRQVVEAAAAAGEPERARASEAVRFLSLAAEQNSRRLRPHDAVRLRRFFRAAARSSVEHRMPNSGRR